jgi:hypothetical protein
MNPQRRCVHPEMSRKAKPWRAKIKIAGKVIDLGRFACKKSPIVSSR